MNKNKISENFSINLFIFFLISYVVLLILKLNGYCDYSGKYHIQEIFCNQIFDNSYLIVDNDMKTTWGMTELHYQKEYFIIKFKKEKDISAINIYASKDLQDKNILFPNIIISASNDGHNWNECKYELNKYKDRIEYNFLNSCKGRFLNLTYNEKTPGYWPISEVKIYDK